MHPHKGTVKSKKDTRADAVCGDHSFGVDHRKCAYVIAASGHNEGNWPIMTSAIVVRATPAPIPID